MIKELLNTMSMRPKVAKRAAVALGVVAIAIAVAACGSSSASSTTAASAGTGTSSAQFQARLSLAKCMRAHGINLPDPSSGGGAAGGGSIFQALRNYPRTEIQSAFSACKQYMAEAFPRVLRDARPARRADR